MASKKKVSERRTAPGDVTKKALKRLAERGPITDPTLVHSERDEDREGNALYKIIVAQKGDPNGRHAEIVVDASGEPVPAARLAGLDVFRRPSFEPLRDLAAAPVAEPITIDPRVNELTLRECATFDEVITVTVPKQPAAKADVYFLADTTGSMFSVIDQVKAGAGTILNAPAWAGRDIAFGVGNYKDFPNDPYAFQHQLDLTTNDATAQAAINTWSAGGGSDGAEGQLYALYKLATDPAIGWRPDAERIVVWFGDAPGHDPVCSAISGLGVDLTLNNVRDALTAANITVLAISTTTGFADGLDDDPTASAFDYTGICTIGGGSGQATTLAAATGGQHVTGIDAADIVSTIVALVDAAVSTINNLQLVPSGAIAPFVTSISPAGGYGPLTGDEEHVLEFKVRFTGVVACRSEPQVFTGSIDVVADGVAVASKRVRIKVPKCQHVYSVKFVCGVQEPGDCEDEPVRPGIYATEINLHNPQACAVEIEKTVIPLVMNGEVIGREPRWSGPRAQDRILLPPDGATMDDCRRLGEMLFKRPLCPARLTLGFLVIRSDRPLEVSVVYTASDLEGRLVTMDVERIESRSGGCCGSASTSAKG